MAQISFTLNIPDAHIARLLENITNRYGYLENSKGLTRQQFLKQLITKWLREEAHKHEQETARAAVMVDEIEVT